MVKPKNKKINWRKFSMIAFVSVLIIIGYFGVIGDNNRLSDEEIRNIKSEIDLYEESTIVDTSNTKSKTGWWNTEYSYYREFQYTNTSKFQKLPAYAPIILTIDHQTLVSQKKSRIDGRDIKVYQKNQNTYQDFPVYIENPNSQETRIYFPNPEYLSAGNKASSFFLYYGNLIETNDNNFEKIKYLPGHDNYQVVEEPEQQPPIALQGDRLWILKNVDEINYNTINLNLSLHSDYNSPTQATYRILTTKTIKEDIFTTNDQGQFKASINTADLEPGIYQIQASLTNNEEVFNSQRIPLIVSQPLYIAHTIDWEGYNASAYNLNKILEFAAKHHNLPTTHFFNPRIYVENNDINETEAQKLTTWIRARYDQGDEIGLHMHMHYDLVEAAGVETIDQPALGLFWSNFRDNGYDIPNSVYNYENYKKILEYSLSKFAENGIEQPKSFRAGLWWIDLENLKTLAETGFKIDASGRDSFSSKGQTNPWKLSATTMPYLISSTDQNLGVDPGSENFGLWEFPNNGGNTTIDDQNLLTSSFDINYPYTYLSQPQTITYLSHAHKFSNDIKKLDPVFYQIDENSVYLDNGPAIYATLEEIYQYYSGK